MELTFVRHTSVDVPPGTCYGQTDVPLKSSFETEAAKVKQQLAGEHFDAVYTSPLSRCTRLAAYCGYPDAIRDPRLMEINFGEWEMKPFTSFTGEHAQRWFDDWINTPAPGGESFMDLYRRVADFLYELRQSDLQNVCIFTHGGVITCARIYTHQYDIKEAFRHIPDYGEVVRMTVPTTHTPLSSCTV